MRLLNSLARYAFAAALSLCAARTQAAQIAYYPFDANANDAETINAPNNNGTLNNGALIDTTAGFPRVGAGALSLDGFNDHVDVGTLTLPTSQFSIAAWVFQDDAGTTIETIVGAGGSGNTANGYKFFINGFNLPDGRIVFETGNGTAGDAATTATGVFQTGGWRHVAVTVNRTAGTARIYYNGVDVTSDQTIRNDFSTAQNTDFGQFNSAAFQLDGRIDDLQFFDTILTPSEVAALAVPEPAGAGLLGLAAAGLLRRRRSAR